MKLFQTFARYISSFISPNSAEHENIEAQERITRYIFNKGNYKAGRGIVKFNEFMPPKNKKISIYLTSTIDDSQIWHIGKKVVEPVRGRSLKARADLLAGIVFEQSLKIISDPEPHPLHADIIDWPTERHEQQMKAVVLAAKSKLVLPA